MQFKTYSLHPKKALLPNIANLRSKTYSTTKDGQTLRQDAIKSSKIAITEKNLFPEIPTPTLQTLSLSFNSEKSTSSNLL